jgi:hypothetical protein
MIAFRYINSDGINQAAIGVKPAINIDGNDAPVKNA